MSTLTDEEILAKAKQIAEANPDEEANNKEESNDESGFEQRFKDTQASYTKAQQAQIEMAKMLVEQDASNVERIPDEKVKRKVLQEKWGVDTIEELKIMFPNYNKSNSDEGEDDETKLEKLEREMKLMRFQNTKTKTNEEIENVNIQYKDIISTIPSFKEKLEEEMKSISEGLSPKSRVEKALKLVLNTNLSPANAYSIMQGISSSKATKDNGKQKKVDKSFIKDIMSRNRI